MLYQNILSLVEQNDSFYFKDFTFGDNQEKTYRLFNYRLCSTSDWYHQDALEARGIVFDITDSNNVTCISRPMQKFFNFKENALVLDISFQENAFVMNKLDGSLISTFNYVNPQGMSKVCVKSKASFYSDVAIDATNYLALHPTFTKFLEEVESLGWTVNMEYTAPHNRIVVKYKEEKLTVLNLRNRLTGEYLLPNDNLFSYLKQNNVFFKDKWFVKNELVNHSNIQDYIQSVYDNTQEDFEGVVIEYQKGLFVKVKSKVYLAAHSLKGGVMDGHWKLYEVIVNEMVDDVKAALSDDPIAIERINSMENHVVPKFNHLISMVEGFVESNKELPLKDFALKAKDALGNRMGLAMNIYRGKPMVWKEYFMSNGKDFLEGWIEPKRRYIED